VHSTSVHGKERETREKLGVLDMLPGEEHRFCRFLMLVHILGEWKRKGASRVWLRFMPPVMDLLFPFSPNATI
jgi:hypothetical protein